MILQDLYKYITDNISGDILTINYSDEADQNFFNGLIFALSKDSFKIGNCSVISMFSDNQGTIGITGTAVLGGISKSEAALLNESFHITINIYLDHAGNAAYSFEASKFGEFKLKTFFGELAPQYMRGYQNDEDEKANKNASLMLLPNNMGDFSIINPVISYYSSDEQNEQSFILPLSIKAGFALTGVFPTLWKDDFNDILNNNITTTMSGRISLFSIYDNCIPFQIEIKLVGSMNPTLHSVHKLVSSNTADGILPRNVSISFVFQHALTFNNYDSDVSFTSANTYLQLEFKFENLPTPIIFTTPIFMTAHYWTLSSEFPNGLGIIDIVNFLSGLFGIDGKEGLLLPSDIPLNTVKLYQMKFGMGRDGVKLTLEDVYAELRNGRAWELLPGLTLTNMSIYWQVQWGGNDPQSDTAMLLTGGIAAELKIKLGNANLTFNAKATIPQLDIEASLEIAEQVAATDVNLQAESSDVKSRVVPTDANPQAALTDIIPQDALNALPGSGSQGLKLARIDLFASYYSRYLSISATVKNALSFRIFNMDVNLAEIYAIAEFTQSGNRYALKGEIDFNKSDNTLLFAVLLSGSYANDVWSFSGKLYRGRVNLLQLINLICGAEIPDKYKLELTDLSLDYSYNRKLNVSSYRIDTAFAASFGTIFGVQTKAGGKLLVVKSAEKTGVEGIGVERAGGEGDTIYASAMFALRFGNFDIIVQADNFYDENKAIYHMRLGFRNKYIRGAYLKRKNAESNTFDDIISISFSNLTFGDIVSWIAELINPNLNYSLPSPWDILNKIDLAKINFEINLTTGITKFQYNVNLSLFGIATLEYIGIAYDKEESGFSIVFKTNRTPEEKFDPITENPPEIAQNPKTFELTFLGLGQHISDTEQKINKASSIAEAMTVMTECFKSEDKLMYNDTVNWLFAADFTIKESLRIQLVINDPNLYGLLISVVGDSLFPALKGLTFEILYKKITSTIGMFKGTLTLPEKARTFQLGAVSITVGVISAQIYTNGNFLIDLGFPHGNDFSLSFGLEFGIFTGRGGFYFGILNGDTCSKLPAVKRGQFKTVTSVGIGIDAGLGRNFDFGIVACGLSLTVTGIFEGLFAVWEDKEAHNQSDIYVKVAAVAGIVGNIYLRVNLAIITLEASATIKAYAAIIIESYRETQINLDVSVRLSATIKIIFFKINVSFNFNKHFSFTIGENRQAPWELPSSSNALRAKRKYMNIAVYTSNQLYDEKVNINLSFSPIFSLEEGEPCAAFLSVLKTVKDSSGNVSSSEFSKLINVLVDWTLRNIPKIDGTFYAAENILSYLTDNVIENEINYTMLDDFLINNLTFVIQTASIADGTDSEGVIITMPPDIRLVLKAIKANQEEILLDVDYNNAVIVSQSYINKIAEYFQNFEDFVKPETQKATNDTETSTAISKVLFLDWFHMILKEIVRNIRSLYQSIDIIEDFDFTCNTYGLSSEQVLNENLDMQLSLIDGEKLIIPSRKVIPQADDSFTSVANKFGSDYNLQTLIDDNKFQGSLLSNGFVFDVGTFEYQNSNGLSAQIVAAMFFIRHNIYDKNTDISDKY